jgi:hypothetical protein
MSFEPTSRDRSIAHVARASLDGSVTMATPDNALSNLAHVSIAERAGGAFPSHTTIRGFLHYDKGQVDLTDVAERGATARVRGKRTEDVELRIEKGRLLIACTCPARSLGLTGCKHVWAVLLEVDRRGAWTALRTTRKPLVVAHLDAPRPEAAAPATKEDARGRPPTTPDPPKKRVAKAAAKAARDAAARRARS